MNITYNGTTDRSEDSTYNFYGGDETLSLYEANRRKARQHTLMPACAMSLTPRMCTLKTSLQAL